MNTKKVVMYTGKRGSRQACEKGNQEQKTIKAAASTKKLMFLFRYKICVSTYDEVYMVVSVKEVIVSNCNDSKAY
ncbi:hypothetical protein INQ25_01100 [Wolbachia endosymbiont of Rhagoletis cerasi]|uniref:hypothetical protein n=1 Tax=Wolbachia endosymbiont of Rhagoletis cerasi TaxID=225363 RepID=UPI001BD62684|nr:hypothetical protein [Wolbachia endosymbiont of Rhagoletis cerasi]MBS9530013.1 hypothetical protein [Wolbachia endosymbiont of Rhagoletis cerasi]